MGNPERHYGRSEKFDLTRERPDGISERGNRPPSSATSSGCGTSLGGHWWSEGPIRPQPGQSRICLSPSSPRGPWKSGSRVSWRESGDRRKGHRAVTGKGDALEPAKAREAPPVHGGTRRRGEKRLTPQRGARRCNRGSGWQKAGSASCNRGIPWWWAPELPSASSPASAPSRGGTSRT